MLILKAKVTDMRYIKFVDLSLLFDIYSTNVPYICYIFNMNQSTEIHECLLVFSLLGFFLILFHFYNFNYSFVAPFSQVGGLFLRLTY